MENLKISALVLCFVLSAMVDGSIMVPASTSHKISHETTTEPTTCHEDQPCWDCETMGNGICGETVELPPSPDNPDGWDTFDQCANFHGYTDGGLAICADVFNLPCDNPYVDPHRSDCH